MADEADDGNDFMEKMLASSLLAQEKRAVLEAAVTAQRKDGLCANDCGDLALPGGAYCCKECAEDADKRRKVISQAGNPRFATDGA